MSMEFLLGAVMTAMFFIFVKIFFGSQDEEEVKKKPTMYLSPERRRFIARWMNSMDGGPDEDGYMGHFTLPEEVMKVYRKMYPNAWG